VLLPLLAPINVSVPACMLSTLECDINSLVLVTYAVISAARHRRCACCTISCSVLGDDTVSDADSDRYLCVDARW
jgi:hypothetical protein